MLHSTRVLNNWDVKFIALDGFAYGFRFGSNFFAVLNDFVYGFAVSYRSQCRPPPLGNWPHILELQFLFERPPSR